MDENINAVKIIIEEFRQSKNTELDLSELNFSIIPDSLGELYWLKSLILNSLDLLVLPESIKNLTNLQTLNLSHTQISNIFDLIGNLTNLQTLDLSDTQILILPESIGNLTNLQNLDLSHTQISILPESIGNLTNLQNLNLNFSKISNLPESIGNLTNLTNLNIKFSKISNLPDSIGNLTNLQNLNLNFSKITNLPDSIGNLTNLQNLDLMGNQISNIPDFLVNLTNLQNLGLVGTQISNIPESIGNLTNLKNVYLRGTQISNIPESIGNLTNLQTLDLSDTQISILPEFIGNLTNLTDLNVSGTQISILPESIGKLTNLTNLNINFSKISILPEFIGNFTNLTELYVSDTQISILPEFIGNLTNLTDLNVSDTQISILPESIGNLTNLQTLDLSDTQIIILPDFIGNLTNLQALDLSDTQISILPEFIGNLTNLQILDLSDTQIIDLPNALSNLVHLLTLNLDNTTLNSVILAAYSLGIDSLLQYLCKRAQAEVHLNETKLILVGEGAVGKSSLLGALGNEPWINNRETTHGIDIKQLILENSVNKEKIFLNCWDFGGQEIYRPTHQFYFSAPAVYLVVWKPREGVEPGFVENWIKLIKHRTYHKDSGEIPRIIVVATHKGSKERQANIDKIGLRESYGDLIVDFFHVDSESQDEFENLKNKIVETALSITKGGYGVALDWKKVLDVVQKNYNESPYLEYNKFILLCIKENIDIDFITIYAKLLHNLGYAIYYWDNNGLKDIIVLNPEWLSKAISFVLDDENILNGNGLVEHRYLSGVWNDSKRDIQYDKKFHPIFIQLMEEFDISYRVVRENKYCPASLVAQLVPVNRPNDILDIWNENKNLSLCELKQICCIVDADILKPAKAEGMIIQLIVRFHQYSLGRDNFVKSRHWQMGIILDNDYNGRAFLEMIDGDIHITVRAPYPDRFMSVICNEITGLISQQWKGLKSLVKIPCPNIEPKPCKGLLDLEEMIDSRNHGNEKCRCDICKKWYNIDDLLVKRKKTHDETTYDLLKKFVDQISSLKIDCNQIFEKLCSHDNKTDAILSRMDEFFAAFLAITSDEEINGPRLFYFKIIEPSWKKPGWVSQKIRITLCCEHSKTPIPNISNDPKDGVYDMEIPREWFVKVIPYLHLTSSVLSVILPVAKSINSMLDFNSYMNFQKEVKLSLGEIESIIKTSDLLDKEILDYGLNKIDNEIQKSNFLKISDPTYGRLSEEHGAGLRYLQSILKEMDPKQYYGGLERVRTNNYKYIWVHETFVKEYNPPKPEF